MPFVQAQKDPRRRLGIRSGANPRTHASYWLCSQVILDADAAQCAALSFRKVHVQNHFRGSVRGCRISIGAEAWRDTRPIRPTNRRRAFRISARRPPSHRGFPSPNYRAKNAWRRGISQPGNWVVEKLGTGLRHVVMARSHSRVDALRSRLWLSRERERERVSD